MADRDNVRVPPLYIKHAMKGLPIRVVSRDKEVEMTPMQAVRFAQALLRSAEAQLSKEWE